MILGAPRVKKNGARSVINRATGKMVRINTPAYTQWHKDALKQLPWPHKPIPGPVILKCLFYMDTKRQTDLSALYEGVQDILVEVGVLEDDNYTQIAGHDGSRVCVDKDNPRLEFELRTVPELGRADRVLPAEPQPEQLELQ